MSELNIVGTQSTPSIISDESAGTLQMRGDSYPENSFEFFTPVIAWVEGYLDSGEGPLSLELHLLYLNTSSVKAMMDIFDLLEEAHTAGRQVKVMWYYDLDNERIAELAQEFKDDCSYPFEIIGRDQ